MHILITPFIKGNNYFSEIHLQRVLFRQFITLCRYKNIPSDNYKAYSIEASLQDYFISDYIFYSFCTVLINIQCIGSINSKDNDRSGKAWHF